MPNCSWCSEVCHGRVGCFSNEPAKESWRPSKLDELVHKHFDPAKAEIFPYSRFSGFFPIFGRN